MGRVLVTTTLPEGGADPLVAAGHEVVLLDRECTDLTEAVGGVDGVVCTLSDRFDASVLEHGAAGGLRVVSLASVGFDNVDVARARALGIVVCNTPGVLDESTADLAFLLLLAASRLSSDAEGDLRNGRWAGWSLLDHLGRDVHGTCLGLVGFGRIGQAMGRRAAGFGMTVLHHTRTDAGHPGYVADLEELLDRADSVSLHVPLTPETNGLIGAAELAALGSTGVLVNTARGAVVDEAALVGALERGELYAAGIDVYMDEPTISPALLGAPRTVLLPHIGSATTATRLAMARIASTAVSDVLAGRQPAHPVPAA